MSIEAAPIGRGHRRPEPAGALLTWPPTAPPVTATEPILRIIPLGGVGEIGKNMTVFEYGDEIVVIDCGLMFPEEEMFGIDLVVPDVTYLRSARDKVKAFLITHAHEDHVGGLPYVLPEFPGVPVYASTLARGLLGNKFKEHKLSNNPLLALRAGRDRRARAPSTATAFRIGHSIPDAMGIALRTPLGVDRPHGRLQVRPHAGRRQAVRLPRPGPLRPGGRALPAVRLDARREPGLHAVRAHRRRGLPRASWRASTAASSWPPSPATSRASSRSSTPPATFGRKVAVIGRSMEQNVRIATDLATSSTPPDQLVPKDRIKDIADRELVIATTGAQGEPMAGLARMANRDHRFVEIEPGDTVIVSASPIPGNEEYVGAHHRQPLQGRRQRLLPRHQARARLRPRQPGRAQADAQPDPAAHFIPIHGEFRMLVQHGRLAAEVGVAPENIFILENGQPIEFLADGSARRGEPVEAGYVYVDGLSVGEVGDVVLRDRRALANDGMFLVVVTVDKQTGNARRPARDRHPRLRRRRRTTRSSRAPPSASRASIDERPATTSARSALLKAQIKDGLSQYLYEQTKRRPMVFPVVVEV